MSFYQYYFEIGNKSRLADIVVVLSGYLKKDEKGSIPKTISQCYIPLRKIRSEKQYNDIYQKNIDVLMINFSAWKKSRGDGNCYYRSVISTFLIKLFFYNSPDEKIESFLSKINQFYYSSNYQQHMQTIADFWGKINYLFQLRKTTPENKIKAFVEIHKELQNLEFDLSAILVARIISHYTLWTSHEKYASFFMEGEIEFLFVNIMEMGSEAESQELYFLPEGLDIEVTQINIFDRLITNHFPSEDLTGQKIKVSIISKSRGHYDCLYSKNEMESEGYNLSRRAYCYSCPT